MAVRLLYEEKAGDMWAKTQPIEALEGCNFLLFYTKNAEL